MTEAETPVTPKTFLPWEERQHERHELLAGVVTMMTGGTLAHVELCGNLAFALRAGLGAGSGEETCRVYQSDLKVIALDAASGGAVLYPDVTVRCGPRDTKATAVDDPILIAEVLSESTAGHDLHRKRWAYLAIPSLRHLLFIDQDEIAVETVAREAASAPWQSAVLRGADAVLELDALKLKLTLAELYRGMLES